MTKEMQRTTYIQDRKGRFIPTHLVANRRELSAYLKGYGSTNESSMPASYNTRLKNLFMYGMAVFRGKKDLYSRDKDKTIFHPRKLRPLERMTDTEGDGEVVIPDSVEIMQSMERNPGFIANDFWPDFSERDN